MEVDPNEEYTFKTKNYSSLIRKNSFMRAYEHFIYCKYNDKDCSFYNFTEIVHLRYIQCFTFSPNDKVISGNKGLEFIFYKRHSRGKPFVMLNDLEDELFSSDIYDGINVIVHNPDTFPTYAFNYLSTSFALRYGQLATVDVSGLKYKSDMTGRKSCFPQRDPYRQVFTLYTNFRGGANFLEYRYTYEDCIANMKQRYIYEKCNCYSDHLFVPFQDPKNNDSVYRSSYDTADLMNNPNVNEKQEDESIQKFSHFCRDIRHKTSHRLRNEFLCFEQYQKMPTTSVLDKFVQPDKLYATRHNLDARKIERHKVCSLLCEKRIYSTKFFEITDLDPEMTLPVPVIAHYIKALETSKLHFPELQNLWNKMQSDEQSQSPLTTGTTNETDETSLSSKNLIIVNIRISTELIDAWEEELTETLFNLISNLGGTVGLCAGISVLSSFFLVFFFGRALFHAALSLILWFWWAVYLGRPPLPDNNKLNQVNYIGNKIEDTDFHSANYGDSEHINNIEAMETSSSTVSTDTTEIINHSSPLHVSAKNDKSDKFEKFQINRKNLSAQKKSDNNKDKQILNDREESDVQQNFNDSTCDYLVLNVFTYFSIHYYLLYR
ncbi:unnamed protein product [Trichobilharzia regenti]|nr:unnamed protein product [Trichobilharzia regenti]